MIVFRQISDVFQAFLGFNQVGTCLKDYFFITDSTLFQFFTAKNCLFGPFGHENPNELFSAYFYQFEFLRQKWTVDSTFFTFAGKWPFLGDALYLFLNFFIDFAFQFRIFHA